MPIIEYNISIGNIVTILSVVVSTVWLVANMNKDILIVKNDVHYLQQSHKALTEAFGQLGKILTSVAVQDTRINMIDKKLDELAHGHGYVKD